MSKKKITIRMEEDLFNEMIEGLKKCRILEEIYGRKGFVKPSVNDFILDVFRTNMESHFSYWVDEFNYELNEEEGKMINWSLVKEKLNEEKLEVKTY